MAIVFERKREDVIVKIGIQSEMNAIETYNNLIEGKELYLEITDFAYPHNFSVHADHIVEFWKNSKYTDRIKSLHGSFIDLKIDSLDPQIGKISEQRYLWNLGISDQLQIPYTIFHSNFTGNSKTGYLKRWIKAHERLYRKFQSEYDTQILIENMDDPTPLALKVLIEKTEQEVGICLDIGNIDRNSQKPFDTWFAHLGPHCKIIHLKDRIESETELALGTGTIDWMEVFDLIDDYCNDPILILEMEGLSTINTSLELLELI